MTSMREAIRLLRDFQAPRVLKRQQINELLAAGGVNLSVSGYKRLIGQMVDAELLWPVNRRLYLNRAASPPACSDEAARCIEPGAIISLQRLLGAWGVLNNPSGFVTAVVPLHRDQPPPTLGQRINGAGVFVFHGIPARVLEAGEVSDRLDLYKRPFPGGMPIATPEKALIDWIYLGATGRSRMTSPPVQDIDMDELNRDRIMRLAEAAGPWVLGHVNAWLEKADKHVDWDDREDDEGDTLSPSS